MNRIFLFFLVAMLSQNMIAQTDAPIVPHTNVVYLEIIGIGGWGSINYERLLYRKSNHQLQGRIGISTINLKDFTNKFNPDLIIPIAANWLYGNNHKLEIGVGQIISNIVAANEFGERTRDFKLSTNFNIGYRYQKPTGRWLFRCGYTPVIEFYENYRHWGGISFGVAF